MSNTLLVAEQTNVIGPYDGYLGDTLFTALFPPNLRNAGESFQPIPSSAWSLHPGGLNALMADGSTRFVKETIESWTFDPKRLRPTGASINPGGWWENLPPSGVWQKLATRAGDEVSSSGTD